MQTAIVIDNEAMLGPSESVEAVAPKRATRAGGSILAGSLLVAAKITEIGGGSPDIGVHLDEVVAGEPSENEMTHAPSTISDSASESIPTDLNAKELTDAFSKLSVICGIYRPEPGATLVEPFTDAAQHADIVIVDWFLENGSSLAARDIVRRVLTNDAREHGRLRLIAIYTSQPDLPILAQELLNEIRLNASTVEALTLDPHGTVLTGKTTRICFFNKVDSLGVPKQHIVAVKDLPAQLLQEFAMLTEGVLATYAVTSIAAVRRAIHSLIAVFAKELDGAYVAHRCSIPHPEEATDFARELVISEISNLISVDQASDQCTGTPIIQSWIDHIAASGRKFSTADAELSVDLLKDFVANGSSAIDGSSSKQSVPNNPGAHPSKTKAIGASNLAEVFYDSPKEAFERNAEFSRLNTFKREVLRGPIARNGWVPTLSLGTVVRVVSDHPQTQNIAAEFPFQYLVCVQPRCDSVRLKGEISFPFQIAMFNETKFNLVVNDEAMVNQTLWVTYKPRDVVMRKFIPESSSETVKARKTEANQFVFTDVTGRSFAWVGDIKDLKAQKDASELAASVHRVGVDEFEWLRQKSK